jgi:hypothetical protein
MKKVGSFPYPISSENFWYHRRHVHVYVRILPKVLAMKLDTTALRYLTKDDWRVLTAVRVLLDKRLYFFAC